MSEKKALETIKEKAKNGIEKIDTDAIKENAGKVGKSLKNAAGKAGEVIKENAGELKDKAVQTKDEIAEKLTELDRMLEESINEYNTAYTLMNDKGVKLFVERNRSVDTIENIKNLINSIANHPKEFDSEFAEIENSRKQFKDTCEFADRELRDARKAAGSIGAGMAAGASVAFMAPTAAMWIATTFGTASTGTAISTLSGAAATNAALAWLGGGSLAAGGGGMAAGNALLALAGPVGWSIAGATLLTSIILFSKKRVKINKEKNSEIEIVKKNIVVVKEMDSKIKELLDRTIDLKSKLNEAYTDSLTVFGRDYLSLSDDKKQALGTLVNNTLTLSVMLNENVENSVAEEDEETEEE
ncbi:MAG: hypothetical protein K6G43_00280 [Lachnospiraceae bacterium]|nr:hypothetical protein [Lachnospiraceae bacterium]